MRVAAGLLLFKTCRLRAVLVEAGRYGLKVVKKMQVWFLNVKRG